jgi:hypothetical protein
MPHYPPGFFLNPNNWAFLPRRPMLPAYPWTPSEQSVQWLPGGSGDPAVTHANTAQGLSDFADLRTTSTGILNIAPVAPTSGAHGPFIKKNFRGAAAQYIPPGAPLARGGERGGTDAWQASFGALAFPRGLQMESPPAAGGVAAAPGPSPLRAPFDWSSVRVGYGRNSEYAGNVSFGDREPWQGDAHAGYDGAYAQVVAEPFDGMAKPSAGEHLTSRWAFNDLSKNGTQLSFTMGDERDTPGPFKFVTDTPVERNADGSVTAISTVYGFDENTGAYTTFHAHPDAPAIFRIGEDGRLQVLSGEQ